MALRLWLGSLPSAALLASRPCPAAALLLRRGLADQPSTQGPGRPSGPATAATGSTSGLGHFGGAKADYDEKFPQGPGQPAPSEMSAFGRPDPEEERRARTDILLTPHGYVPVRSPEEVEGKAGG